MRTVEYEAPYQKRTNLKQVTIERYRSPAELLEVALGRECAHGMRHDDFLGGDDRRPNDTYWAGFTSSRQAREDLIAGITDDGFARDVARYANTVRTDEVQRYKEMRRSVQGGAVCVPAVLAGDPRGMWCVRRSKAKSRVVRLGIDASVTANYPAKRWEDAGRAVVMTVAALERAGYRVGVETGLTVRLVNDTVLAMTVPVKRPEETINLRRVLFPLSKMAFFRGIGFGWIVRQPRYVPYGNIGFDVYNGFPHDSRDEEMDRLLGQMFGDDSVHVRMRDLCSQDGTEGAAAYLRSMLADAGDYI